MERIIESWITRVENFYSLQSIPVKVFIFIVGVVGVYALGPLLLDRFIWQGRSLAKWFIIICFNKKFE